MRWEYAILELNKYGSYDEIDRLNQFGRDGWELVGIDNHRAYFKRPDMKTGPIAMGDSI